MRMVVDWRRGKITVILALLTLLTLLTSPSYLDNSGQFGHSEQEELSGLGKEED